jgi:ATP-dependent DNA helicase RecG
LGALWDDLRCDELERVADSLPYRGAHAPFSRAGRSRIVRGMSKGRPEILFPLFAEPTSLDGVGPKTATSLEKLDLLRPRDFLFALPSGVVDRRPRDTLADAPEGEVATVIVTVTEHRPPATRGRPWRVRVDDGADGAELVYFRANQGWVDKLLPIGSKRLVSGKVERWNNGVQIAHPDHVIAIRADGTPEDELPPFEPIYPLTEGVGQRLMHRAVQSALERAPDLPEWIEPSLLASKGWPSWRTALLAAHGPTGPDALRLNDPARERLAYDELLSHQLALALARAANRRTKGRPSRGDGRLRDRVRRALPWALTGAQDRSVADITRDMASGDRMNRLLQGDVGSGKTVVALLAMLTAVESGGQAALMAPTEILARQHMESLGPLLAAVGIEPLLLTGRDKGKLREAKLMQALDGAPIIIGTHALFQKDVGFRDLRLAVIDEQHRFGVRQRLDLSAKGVRPDVLVMTATPIPRSLALANYGDMDVSVLDEKPPGRKPVTTALISSDRIEEVIARLSAALTAGRRAYWVCPLVEESDASDLAAAEERARDLRERLGPMLGARVALVHGRMAPGDKDAAMAAFVSGQAQLLVATTVIEVGVNVPEATIMVIEGADSFGLAQLHQLRGRVGRGVDASTCVLMYDPPLTASGKARLAIMRETEDGFRIAEEDLRLRGAGDLLGVQQSGLPKFRVADIEGQAELMRTAQEEARLVLATDPTLDGRRGDALRALLYLQDRDAAIRLLSVG